MARLSRRAILAALLVAGAALDCRFNAQGLPAAAGSPDSSRRDLDSSRRPETAAGDVGAPDERAITPDARLRADGPPLYTCQPDPYCTDGRYCCKHDDTVQPTCEVSSARCLCDIRTQKPCALTLTCCAQGDAIPRCYNSEEAQDCL